MEMTYREWKKQYKPVWSWNITSARFHVWTLCHTDGDGAGCIKSGIHYVNRVAYFVTEKPYNDGDNITISFKRKRDYNRFFNNLYRDL